MESVKLQCIYLYTWAPAHIYTSIRTQALLETTRFLTKITKIRAGSSEPQECKFYWKTTMVFCLFVLQFNILNRDEY